MSLTPQELEMLRAQLKRQERWARTWPQWRWILLVIAIVQIATAIHSYTQLDRFSDPTLLSAVRSEDSPPAQIIDSAIEARTDLLRAEMRVYVGVIVSAAAGLALLCLCVISWRGSAHTAAQYLLIKHMLERHEASSLIPNR